MQQDPYKQAVGGAIVSQNIALIQVIGMILGFIGGLLIGAYVFFPMGGNASLFAIACPIIGLVVGQRLLLSLLAR